MSKTIRGITIEIGATTTGLGKALEDVNKKSKDIQGELRKVERLLKFNPKNTELLAQKQKLLSEQVENTRKKLDRLKDAQAQVNEQYRKGEISEEQYRDFQREIVETESKLNHYEKKLKEVSGSHVILGEKLEDIGTKLQDMGSKMTDVGKNFSLKLTAPLVTAGTASLKSGMEFETAFAGVRKTVNATEEEFKGLETGIRDMSKEIPKSSKEIAGLAENAGQLGIETPNILDFTRVMIDLGETTNLSAEEGSSALAKFANITNMSQGDFDRLGSTILKLGNNSATTEKDIVDMAMGLAGAGTQVGMSEADILALSTALSSVGIESQAGGSAFSKVMVEMQLAAETGGEKLQGFADVAGMSADEFAQAYKEDAAGALLTFIEGLATSEERGVSAIGVLDEMGITEVRLRDALLRSANASDIFSDSLELGSEAWEENTELQRVAGEAYDTNAANMEIFKNKVTDVAMSIGEILLPKFMDFIEKVEGWIEKFDNLSDSQKEMIVKIGLVAAAIGPALIVFGTLSKGMGSAIKVGGKVIKNWDKIKGAGSMMAGLLKPLLGGLFTPWGIAIAGAIAVGILLWKNWDTIKAKAGEMLSNLKTKFNNIRTAMVKPIEAARDKISSAIDKIKGFFSNLKLKFPDIKPPKLPKFSLTGKFSLTPPQVPKVGIKWFAKGGVLDRPTIFGAMGNKLLGGGEAGREGIVPLEGKHMLPMADAIAERLNSVGKSSTIVIENMNVRDESDIEKISQRLYELQNRKSRGRGQYNAI